MSSILVNLAKIALESNWITKNTFYLAIICNGFSMMNKVENRRMKLCSKESNFSFFLVSLVFQ